MRTYRLTITNVVKATYCEQKLVFDRHFGDATPASIRALADKGTRQHKKFEAQGNLKQATDSRCFIATHVFGGDAPQTWRLRQWRDESLMTHGWGRALVQTYYALSPSLIRLFGHSRTMQRLARTALNAFIKRISK